MSDVMLFGVLRMPPELWQDSEIDKSQRYARYVEAADRIDRLTAENGALRAACKTTLMLRDFGGMPQVRDAIDEAVSQAEAALAAKEPR